MTESQIVTVKEWAEALGKSERTVQRMLAAGALPSYPGGPGFARITTRKMFDDYFSTVPKLTPNPVVVLHQRRRAS